MQVSEKGERRSYSICSTPDVTHGFELLVDISPQGVGSKYLESLEFGQEVAVLAPLGVFTALDMQAEAGMAFVATGAGIAPFRGIILDQLQNKKDTRPITLYWGLREAEHMFWQNEFAELSENFPNFKFHPTLSQAPADWPLCKGRVTHCLQVHELTPDVGYYLCGNQTMIHDVIDLLQSKGVSPDRLHHEKFY
jgi:Na+-transporting NADH:ubiquinone oxidoreductase subunit F